MISWTLRRACNKCGLVGRMLPESDRVIAGFSMLFSVVDERWRLKQWLYQKRVYQPSNEGQSTIVNWSSWIRNTDRCILFQHRPVTRNIDSNAFCWCNCRRSRRRGAGKQTESGVFGRSGGDLLMFGRFDATSASTLLCLSHCFSQLEITQLNSNWVVMIIASYLCW